MDRKDHWEKIYTEKSALEVSWYQKVPTLSLQLIHETKLEKNASIIDVGGGASVLVDNLLNEGYKNLAVLDISLHAINTAKKRLADNAKSVEWFEADVTNFVSPHQFDLWHDRAVFHFLTDAGDRQKYIDVLKRTLKPGGHLILSSFAIGGPIKCSGLDICQYDSSKLQNELDDNFKLMEETGEIHLTPAGREQKFSYFRFTFR